MIFTNTAAVLSQPSTTPHKKIPRKSRHDAHLQTVGASIAPNTLHPPVNHLHPIEKSKDTVPHFSLTLKMKSVKR